MNVIKYPLATEKSIRMLEAENKLIFVVERKASKDMIKHAIENMFNAKVDNINTAIVGSEKRAYVKFKQDTPAIDVATKLGLM